jgi:hypothetical protein
VKKVTIAAIAAFILLMLFTLIMASSCVTTQPVPDTRPVNNNHQLAKQAEQITNSKQ